MRKVKEKYEFTISLSLEHISWNAKGRGGEGWILDSALFAHKTRFIGSSQWLLLPWTHYLSLSSVDVIERDDVSFKDLPSFFPYPSSSFPPSSPPPPYFGRDARAFLPYLSSFRLEKYLFGERSANDLINPWKAQSSVAVSLWAEQLRPRKENNYRYRAFLPLFYTLSYILSTFNRRVSARTRENSHALFSSFPISGCCSLLFSSFRIDGNVNWHRRSRRLRRVSIGIRESWEFGTL